MGFFFFIFLLVFQLALRGERCWWWKSSFFPNSLILNYPCPLRVLQIPPCSWQIKSVLIWQEMESGPGVQQKDPFDFPFNFFFIFPLFTPFHTSNFTCFYILLFVGQPSVSCCWSRNCLFLGMGLDALGGITNPRAADFTVQTETWVQHWGLCVEGRWHRGHRV